LNDISIRYADASQEDGALQDVARDVAKVLTPNEEIYYIALQNATALSLKKDAVVATNNRLIIWRPSVLGRVGFDDLAWQDVANVRIDQGMLSTQLTVEGVDGRTASLANLEKEQAKRLYGVCQQLEQEWREKRRIREMDEARARAGGIQIGSLPFAGGPGPTGGEDDSVARLAKAKQMLDQGLISEAEYDTLKAKILSSI
jgi:hypothetical protein